jgi:sterol desaturase/sphingolipid hydroxylase (fatty acid hydroxylase superfamily)
MYETLVTFLKADLPWLYAVLAPLVHMFRGGGWIFVLAALCIFLLEWLKPARSNQPVWSRGLFLDVLWWTMTIHVTWVTISGFVPMVNSLSRELIGPMTIGSPDWPLPVQVIFTVLAVDLLNWFHHFVRHKVPLFWAFHAVHHAQREMNFLTCLRVHPIDYMTSAAVMAIPLAILLPPDIAGPGSVVWTTLNIWHERLYHSNVKLDFGPLRWILVTPQSHRIHHSSQPEHHDRNFGVLFCIWDRLFGTQYDGHRDEYPQTGVYDPTFPDAKDRNPLQLIRTFVLELFYPFVLLFRSLTRRTANNPEIST